MPFAALVFVSFFSGLLLKSLPSVSDHARIWLNHWIMKAAFPAFVLIHVRDLKLDTSALLPVASVWIAQVACLLAVLLLSRVARFRKEVVYALMVVAVLGNTSFLGFPAVVLLLGETSLPYAVIYDQLGTFLALSIYVPVVLAISGAGKVSGLDIGKKLLVSPPFLALVFGLLFGQALPDSLITGATWLSKTLIPATLCMIGIQFTMKVLALDAKAIAFGLAIKMLLSPFIVFVFLTLVEADKQVLAVSVIEAAMPPMVMASLLMMMANLAPKMVAAMLSYGLLLACVSLPAITFFLQV